MTTTPALARATVAQLEHCSWRMECQDHDGYCCPACDDAHNLPTLDALDAHRAHATVSAALHDPDHPDWLARVVDAHSPFTITSSPPVRCECGRWVENHSRHVADAVRAAILGEAS